MNAVRPNLSPSETKTPAGPVILPLWKCPGQFWPEDDTVAITRVIRSLLRDWWVLIISHSTDLASDRFKCCLKGSGGRAGQWGVKTLKKINIKKIDRANLKGIQIVANSDQWCRSAVSFFIRNLNFPSEAMEAELSHRVRREGELPLQTTSQLLLISWKKINIYKYNGKKKRKKKR